MQLPAIGAIDIGKHINDRLLFTLGRIRNHALATIIRHQVLTGTRTGFFSNVSNAVFGDFQQIARQQIGAVFRGVDGVAVVALNFVQPFCLRFANRVHLETGNRLGEPLGNAVFGFACLGGWRPDQGQRQSNGHCY